MSKVNVTQHVKKRMQQRAISELQIRLIREFGQYEYQKGGAQFALIPEKTISELRHALDKLPGIALILGEKDCVITALHQTRRINRTNYTS
jgi:hypothetical protein